jgi:hypothetical protein
VTEVITTYFSPRETAALATCCGSSSRGGAGDPFFTAQKAHARVQTSPKMRKVAVRADQHSPVFGQRALSQIVWRPLPFKISVTSK